MDWVNGKRRERDIWKEKYRDREEITGERVKVDLIKAHSSHIFQNLKNKISLHHFVECWLSMNMT